eukprot:Filipodium_phascolosomae@DN1830_c0_g1_i1.p1
MVEGEDLVGRPEVEKLKIEAPVHNENGWRNIGRLTALTAAKLKRCQFLISSSCCNQLDRVFRRVERRNKKWGFTCLMSGPAISGSGGNGNGNGNGSLPVAVTGPLADSLSRINKIQSDFDKHWLAPMERMF